MTINGQSSLPLLPSNTPVNLTITPSGPINGLKPGQSTITSVAGTCAKPTLTPSDIHLSGSALALGQQTFIYDAAVAASSVGCSFRITAVADTGVTGSADFTPLLCSAGSSPVNPSCSTSDGHPGRLVCAQNGLSYACVANAAQNCTFNGQTVLNGASVQVYPSATVPYGSTCALQVRTCQNGVLSGSGTSTTCSVLPGASCSFNSQTIADGAHVTGYMSASVPAGQTCQNGDLICRNGGLEGAFIYPTCSVAASLDCTVNGQPLRNGQTTVVYQTQTVNYDQTCQSQTLRCTNGVVSGGANGSFYSYTSCSVTPERDCNFNGQVVTHGSQVTAYRDSTVGFGGSCASESRRCTNGSLSGSYTNSGCSVQGGANCSYNGQSLASGSSASGYAASRVPYGQACTTTNSQCVNGAMNPTIYPSCTSDPGASCNSNGHTIADGGTDQGYTSSSVPFGSTCTNTSATCHNGTMSASIYPSCIVQADPNCHVSGVDIANGGSHDFFQSASVPFGQNCVSETRTCNNGSASGSFAATSCTVGQPIGCVYQGQSIAHNSALTVYNAQNVPYDQTCQSASASCYNGAVTVPNGYVYSACNRADPLPCTFHGQTIPHGGSVPTFPSATVPFGSSCVSEQRTCTNGNLSGSAENLGCTVNDPATCSFNGQTIAHNATVTAFSAPQVLPNQTCQSSTATCYNGSLPLTAGYTYGSCSVASTYPPDTNICDHIGEACSAFDPVAFASAKATVDYCSDANGIDTTIRCGTTGLVEYWVHQCVSMGGRCNNR